MLQAAVNGSLAKKCLQNESLTFNSYFKKPSFLRTAYWHGILQRLLKLAGSGGLRWRYRVDVS